ncbi:hypothetical protein EUTSA_v10011078mg [Eutrema salsugineum]|uniref:Uncharacterized protein n=1 Tax=Eutrema salsugineum TaxID=72664 RepID=V4L6G3_EUTSA|nr:cation/H(+) antiporter 12 [Eutrema salsugineum]ESQ45930.1 hypothetical protein EUTSA_v10011078mg [Eutrema salsugineum]
MNATTYIEELCQPLLFNISSKGLWENLKSPGVIFGYSLPLLEIQILLIFVSFAMSHMILRFIGISPTASYLMAGLIMGPQLFDLREKSSRILSWDPELDGNGPLKGISTFAAILFTFLLTLKTNRRVVFSSGKLPIVIGISTFFVPLLVGLYFRIFAIGYINPHYMPRKRALVERTVIIGSQSCILLPTTTYILLELKILNSEFGRLVLSASIINDLLAIALFVTIYTLGTYRNISTTTAYSDVIGMIIFILVVIFLIKPAIEWIVENTPEGKPVADIYVDAVIVTVLASVVYSTFFNMKHVMGPFLIGLVIPEGPPLGSALEAKYEKLTMNVFSPLSIAFSAMRCDIMKIIYQLDDLIYNMFLMALTLVLKLVAGLVPCLYCRLPLRESIAVSILLSCKSFAEIFLFETALDDGYMSHAMYSFLIVYLLINSAIVPTILRGLYDPKRKYVGHQERNILSLKPNSDLRILTCVHRPDNIPGAIAFLQLLSSPNRELPIIVTVLHLVKLVGQLFPVLIPHNTKSKRLMTNNSYISTVLLTFNKFKHESLDSASLAMFTAFSHENLMHEDICTLALDQTTSMIVVPSGRTWTIDGEFDMDDESIRRLNMSLLECAPCSIGILVDRGKFLRRENRRSNINVGVIFIGGKDDREALSLVKRMKHNPKVRVTVIRLISTKETEYTNSVYGLDHKVMKEMEDSEATNNITYTETSVTGGPELATTVRLLAEEYDLMVVGRDHGKASPDFSGLKEWMELPELGVIGDLLAVRDLKSRLSVLVVQHQHHALNIHRS